VQALILAVVVALVVGFVGAGLMRSPSSSPTPANVLTPSRPAVTTPAPAATAPPATATDDLTSAQVASVAAKVDDGIVNIDTVLGFGEGRAAGTGMVLTSSGRVLTNNHVIAGSTKITVTVVDTGKTYTASVVGTAPTEDVAVLQLQGASGLKTITTAKASTVDIGDPVVAAGNAGGKGGAPTVAAGSITGLNQSITASDSDGSNAQRLTGLIETDAAIQPGDSGGPLADADGNVIGMDSAAEVTRTRGRGTTTRFGYAIPIEKAMSIAAQIQSGNASATIHIGLPAFLGVQLVGSANGFGRNPGGAVLAGVESGTPAASIGLGAGDTITSINGNAVTSASTLSAALAAQRPGDRVSVGWTDSDGTPHTANATLIAGPAD